MRISSQRERRVEEFCSSRNRLERCSVALRRAAGYRAGRPAIDSPGRPFRPARWAERGSNWKTHHVKSQRAIQAGGWPLSRRAGGAHDGFRRAGGATRFRPTPSRRYPSLGAGQPSAKPTATCCSLAGRPAQPPAPTWWTSTTRPPGPGQPRPCRSLVTRCFPSRSEARSYSAAGPRTTPARCLPTCYGFMTRQPGNGPPRLCRQRKSGRHPGQSQTRRGVFVRC